MARDGLDDILALARQGIRVFPIHGIDSNGHCTCAVGKDCTSPGKHPRWTDWDIKATDNPEKIRNWWESFPVANWAAATGKFSRLFVVDIDPKNGGDKTWETLVKEHGWNDQGMIAVITGSGGWHYYLKHYNEDIISRQFEPGVDVKGEMGLVVIPPSKHYSGGTYAWQPGHSPKAAGPGDAPSWIKERVEAAKVAQEYGPMAGGWEKGNRNNKLYHHALALFRAGSTREVIEAAFQALVESEQAFIDDPMPWEEIERAIDNAFTKFSRDATATMANGSQIIVEQNDTGNASRFVFQHSENIRFIPEMGQWLVWDSNKWRLDW